jgi:hypothetical protein
MHAQKDAEPGLPSIGPVGTKGTQNIRDAEGGVNAAVGDGLAAVEAFGVDAEQNFDAVPGTLGDLCRWYSSVEPERDSRVPHR